MMDKKKLRQKFIKQARKIFEGNFREGYAGWNKSHYKFISPAPKEYVYQWLWDSAFHAIVLANFDVEWAKSEVRQHLAAQWEDGFIPHIIFWGGNTTSLPHWAFIESKRSFRPHTSALTQPPALALAVEEVFEKDHDMLFLNDVLPKLARHHRWLLENRDPDGDFLISIISPNESGMDESPVFQVVAGYKGNNTARLHYAYRKGDLLNNFYNFNSKKILEKDYFNVEELVFNTIFIEANRSLSRLFAKLGGQEGESKFFKDSAEKGEQAMFEKCWDSKEKIFYSIYSKNEIQVKVKTAASLVPLFLEGIKGDQLNCLIKDHLLNPEEFWRPYPVPSVSADEIYYNPKDPAFYQIKLLWRGPTWINTNWFIVKGLRKHGMNELADKIVDKMVEMIEKWGYREYYNPETGQGYRRENFGWSTLIVDLL